MPRPVALLAVGLLALAALGCRRAEPAPLGRLAYVRGDTLYVQALPDGAAHELSVGRGLTQPRWSPSGDWLAFRRNDSLRLERSAGGLGSGGQTLAGPEATAFAWAPADDRLAYVGGGNLIVARAGGMAVVLVERTRDAAVQELDWSTDGGWLSYTTQPPAGAAASARPASWRIRARGGQPELVAVLPQRAAGDAGNPGHPGLPGWTPDGVHMLKLALERNGQGSLWLGVRDGAARRLATGLGPPRPGSEWNDLVDYRPPLPSRE
ncbi:MAG TPA: hypothetical protein VF832_00020 [Longimicrobiales bacterium]